MLEPLGMLGGYIARLFVGMFVWQRMAASGYWFWGIIVLLSMGFIATVGSGIWQVIWLLSLGLLEVTIIAFGLLERFGSGSN